MNYSTAGLLLDLIGVTLIGCDVITFQRSAKIETKSRSIVLNEVKSELKSIYENLETKEPFSQVSGYSSHYHDADYTEANIEQSIDGLNRIYDEVFALTENVKNIAKMLYNNSEYEKGLASKSFPISIIGLILSIIGFILQIIGNVKI